MKDWYNYSWTDIVEKLESDEEVGLNANQVNSIKEICGANRIFNVNENISRSLIKKIILEPWFIILTLTSFLMLICKSYWSGTLLLFLTISSNLIYWYDDLSKAKNIKQLERIDEINTSVMRDGRIYMIAAEELVVGDIVFMQKGSAVPADIRIIELENLKIKQTSVTGEIYEVEKHSTKIEEMDISLVEMKNMLFKSSVLMNGSCCGIVTSIGSETEVGKIVKTLFRDTKRVEKFEAYFNTSKLLLEVIAFLSALMVVIISITMGNGLNLVINKIALVIAAASPLILIIVVSIFLVLTKKVFRKNGIQIKGISSMEVASSISAVYAQKLGFFYENKIIVQKIYTDEETKDYFNEEIEVTKNIERIIYISLLCNNNSKNSAEEKALIEFAKKSNIEKASVDVKFRRIIEIPFDIERGLKTTVNKSDKHYRACVVGRVLKVLEKCKFIMKNGIEHEITIEDIENIKLSDMEMSSTGLAVTAFANRNFNYAPSIDENIESYLVFVGLMGLKSTLKQEAKAALQEAEEMDFTTIISSEDSKLTTLSLGNQIGVKMLPRISLKDKLKVLKDLKDSSNNILVTGTKLTDLPLLEAGDARIAYGINCSTTLKAISDAFIENENFEKVIFYLKESKPSYIKFIKFLKYSFAISICQGIYMAFYCGFIDKSINTAYEILWYNMIFVILSFIYFYKRKYFYRFYEEPEKKIYFTKIIFSSFCTGFFSFVISNLIVDYKASMFILLIMELIFINTKFND